MELTGILPLGCPALQRHCCRAATRCTVTGQHWNNIAPTRRIGVQPELHLPALQGVTDIHHNLEPMDGVDVRSTQSDQRERLRTGPTHRFSALVTEINQGSLINTNQGKHATVYTFFR